MNPSEHHIQHPRMSIDARTGVSMGLIVVVISGIVWLTGGINSIKNEISASNNLNLTTKMELMSKIEKVESRVISLETNKSAVTTTQFFQWAVHLQQSNPQIKVPEPQIDSK